MMQCTGTILVHVSTSFVFYMYIYLFLTVGVGTIRIGKYIGDQRGRKKGRERLCTFSAKSIHTQSFHIMLPEYQFPQDFANLRSK